MSLLASSPTPFQCFDALGNPPAEGKEERHGQAKKNDGDGVLNDDRIEQKIKGTDDQPKPEAADENSSSMASLQWQTRNVEDVAPRLLRHQKQSRRFGLREGCGEFVIHRSPFALLGTSQVE